MNSELNTISGFNLQRYLGTWYEIARLPMRHEPEDSTDISATYNLNEDGKVRVQNRRLDGQGQLDESIGEATPVDAEHGKLEVSFLPEGLRWIPFTKGDYWILKLDPEYQTASVTRAANTYGCCIVIHSWMTPPKMNIWRRPKVWVMT